MSTLTQFISGGGGGGVKSIQRGTFNLIGVTSGSATITSVNVAKTELRTLGQTTTIDAVNELAYATLNSATAVAFTKTANTGNTIVSWELTEYL